MKKTVCAVAVFLSFGIFTGVQASLDEKIITSPEQLAALYESQVENLPPVPGPDEMWITLSPQYLPAAFPKFPVGFVDGLMAHEEYGLEVYDLFLIPDPAAGELVFCNEAFEEVAALAWYDSESQWIFGVYALSVTLVDARDWDDLQKALAEEAEAAEEELLLQPLMTRSTEDGISPDAEHYIRADITSFEDEITVSMIISNGFTNAVEIYSTDNLLTGGWSLRATNIQFSGGFTNTWTDSLSTNTDKRFYVIGNGGMDLDGDGLIDAREAFIYLTDRSKFDTDGDGIGDGEELMFDGTDPLNFYSVRPPDRLRASGASIVDESGNPVVVCAENYGGWLAWEHWMLQFKPHTFTNILNHVVGIDRTYADDGASVADLYDLLVDNVDESVTLLVSQTNDASSGITNHVLISDNPDAIGSFDAGDWLCFSNVVLYPNMTNLAVIYARAGDLSAGAVEIRLGTTNGTLIGSFKTGHTGGWDAYDENIFYGVQSVAATTQNVYFVGAGAGGLGNFYSFRLYSSANTESLITQFRNNYFQTNELDRLKELGFNTLRLPFNHNLLLDETGTNWLAEGWSYLDRFIDECAKRRMYCILDLHGVSGGQNWYEQCTKKQGTRNRLWAVPKYQEQLMRLWDGISDRYATNPAVLGYDLLNEPFPYAGDNSVASMCAAYTNYLIPLHDRLYKTIRSNDTAHLIFMEDNFHATNNSAFLWITPEPAAMGWSNVVYQFHSYEKVLNAVYTGALAYLNWEYETQKQVADDNVRNCVRFMRERQVPVFLGEFQPGDPYIYDYAVRRYIDNHIGWCHWNYKVWGWEDTNHPDQGWTSWGLAYREYDYAAAQPDIVHDSYEELLTAFAEYGCYTNNEALQRTFQTRNLNAAQPTQSNKFSELYVNTFDGGNADSINSSWAWEKVTGIGVTNMFQVASQKARLYFDYGSLLMRLMARKETEAWFDVDDPSGATFELDVCGFSPTTNDAEIVLNITGDIHTNRAYNADSESIMARVQKNKANQVRLSLYAKGPTANTWGSTLYDSGWVGFTENGTLQVVVNQSGVSLSYLGVSSGTKAHGLDLSLWTDGAIAVVEAENIANTTYVELDNFRIEGPTQSFSDYYANYFSGIPDLMMIRALPDTIAIKDTWNGDLFTASYVTNDALVLLPEPWDGGASWLAPCQDYYNLMRMELSGSNVCELAVKVDDFSTTNFYMKVCFLPEHVPGKLYRNYAAQFPYVDISVVASGSNAGHLGFDLNKPNGLGNPIWLTGNEDYSFNPGTTISFQISTNQCRVYYGTVELFTYTHNLDIAQCFPDGLYPHVELEIRSGSDLTATIDSIKCEQLDDFYVPID